MPIESPKARFLKSDHAKLHADIINHPTVIAALDVALLQMEQNQGTAGDMSTAAARHFMLSGARSFRNLFLQLSEPEKEPTQPKGDNLSE